MQLAHGAVTGFSFLIAEQVVRQNYNNINYVKLSTSIPQLLVTLSSRSNCDQQSKISFIAIGGSQSLFSSMKRGGFRI